VQQFAADGLAGAAFEQDVVRHHHGGAAVDLEQCVDASTSMCSLPSGALRASKSAIVPICDVPDEAIRLIPETHPFGASQKAAVQIRY